VKPVDLVVRDGRLTDTGSLPATLSIAILNTGHSRSVVTRIHLTVVNSMVVEPCDVEGGLEVSGSYDIELPDESPVGTEFSVPISQQVAADEADRFIVRIGLKTNSLTPIWPFYRLKVALEANGNPTRIPVGTVAFFLPNLPNNTDAGTYWSAEFATGKRPLPAYPEPTINQIVKCMKQNSLILKRLLAQPGERSAELIALASDLR
jgi:hypothetical protein